MKRFSLPAEDDVGKPIEDEEDEAFDAVDVDEEEEASPSCWTEDRSSWLKLLARLCICRTLFMCCCLRKREAMAAVVEADALIPFAGLELESDEDEADVAIMLCLDEFDLLFGMGIMLEPPFDLPYPIGFCMSPPEFI